MSKILWIGDAGTSTGFGRVSEEIGSRLIAQYGHDIHALAIGWSGKDPYYGPLKLYRANAGPGRSIPGYDRVAELVVKVEPDVVIVNEDPPSLLRRIYENRFDPEGALRGQKVLAYTPIDGESIPPPWLEAKQDVKYIAYCKFGAKELEVDDYIYHGVDTSVFRKATPENPIATSTGVMIAGKASARDAFGIDPDNFVIGRVDTNSERKDYGKTWEAIQQAYALGLDPLTTTSVFHTKQASYVNYGVDFRYLVPRGDGKFMITNGADWPTEDVVALMNAFDVFISTSRGEGFGLTLLEAMACEIPIIATDCSSIPEVVGKGGILVPPAASLIGRYGIDQSLADSYAMGLSLVELAGDEPLRREIGLRGRARAEGLTWDKAAAEFHDQIESMLA